MSLLLVCALLAGLALAESESYPRDAVTVEVQCSGGVNFFQCKPDWEGSKGKSGAWASEDERIQRIVKFANLVSQRKDTAPFFDPAVNEENYPGWDLIKDMQSFFKIQGNTELTGKKLLGLSYFLEYYASNTFSVSAPSGKKPVVGFSGSLFSAEGDEELYYDEDFMNAFRDVTVQYKIILNGDEKNIIYAINYMGSFSMPYFFYNSAASNNASGFAAAYNMDKQWATAHGGKFEDFVKYLESLNKEKGQYLPGVFMANYLGVHSDVNSSIGYSTFKESFKSVYGLVNGTIGDDDRYVQLKNASWNFCRSLKRNNVSDVNVSDPEEPYDYDYVEPGTGGVFTCNMNYLPSYFFMVHTLKDTDLPMMFSTKYQLEVDGSCQFRTDLNNKGMPTTEEAEVLYGEVYEKQEEKADDYDLPAKSSFILNGSDFFGLHVVQDREENSTYEEEGVPTSYYYYELNNDNIDKLYYDSDSFCNTAVSDTYVLYDMKEYASVYGSLTAITSASFGYESVYSSMKAYPTKSNYTAVITAAQVDSDDASKVNVKTQLQKCVNVFLDTQGLDIAACNDVTSTWDWGVFGGSLAGLIVVVGLWVWGGMYNKKFNANKPPYYTDLERYEPEWRRLEQEALQRKMSEKLAKKSRRN